MDDLQTIHCPSCGKPLEVAPGSHLACPFCGQRLVIERAEPPRMAPGPAPRPLVWGFPASAQPRRDTGAYDAIRVLAGLAIAGVIIVGGIWAMVTPHDPLAQLVGAAALVGLYFAPTLSAMLSAHRNTAAIAIVNLLLGWTIVGWVAAAAWAAMRSPKASA